MRRTDGGTTADATRSIATRLRDRWAVLCMLTAGLLSLSVLAGLGAQPSSDERGASAPATRPVPLFRKADDVAIITIQGPIGGITSESFQRRLRIAEKNNADAVVVEIDTPGGEVGAVLEICQAIKESTIDNFVAWINAEAYSGGAIIALACREIVVARGAKMGDALPIAVGPGGLQALPPAERGKILAPLLTEVLDSARRVNRNEYLYDEYLVQSIVTGESELWWLEDANGVGVAVTAAEYESVFGEEPKRGPTYFASQNPGAGPTKVTTYPAPGGGGESRLTPTEAQEFRPANEGLEGLGTAIEDGFVSRSTPGSTRPDVGADPDRWTKVTYLTDGSLPITMTDVQMAKLRFAANVAPDGSLETINTDEELQAWFDATNLKRLDPLWSEGLVQFMTNPIIRGVLIVLFLLSLFVAMVSPGTGGPEIVVGIALVLLLAPPMLMGLANWWEIVAILTGIVLLALEIFVLPGTGIAGVLGLLALFVGLLFTFVPDQGSGLFPDSKSQQQDLMYGLLSLVVATVTAGAGVYVLSKKFGTLPMLDKLVLANPDPDEAPEESVLLAMGAKETSDIQVGDEGVAMTTLRPVGEIEIAGNLMDAVAENGFIRPGTRVRVCEIRDLSVVVTPATKPVISADGTDKTGDEGEASDGDSSSDDSSSQV